MVVKVTDLEVFFPLPERNSEFPPSELINTTGLWSSFGLQRNQMFHKIHQKKKKKICLELIFNEAVQNY